MPTYADLCRMRSDHGGPATPASVSDRALAWSVAVSVLAADVVECPNCGALKLDDAACSACGDRSLWMRDSYRKWLREARGLGH